MELYQLRYFRTLCKYEHFTRASESLYITCSALTKAVKQLENELGQQLIDRSQSTFALTPAGEILLKGSQKILDDVDAVIHEFDEFSSGTALIRLAVDRAICTQELMEAIGRFLQQNEGVDIWVIRRKGNNLDQALKNGLMNLGIMFPPAEEDDRLEYVPFTSREFGLCIQPTHALAKKNVIDTKALRNKKFELINLYEGDYAPFRDYFCKYQIQLTNGAVSDSDIDNAKQIVGSGLGMAILPLSCDKGNYGVVFWPFNPPLKLDYVFVRPKTIPLTKPLKKLINHLKQTF